MADPIDTDEFARNLTKWLDHVVGSREPLCVTRGDW